MKKCKVESLQVLAQTKFLNLYKATYTDKNEKCKSWFIASRKDYDILNNIYMGTIKEKTDAVVIVALHKETKSLVVIRQFRVPTNDYIYEMPAGLIDEGEDFKQTAIRELKEETGLEIDEIYDNICTPISYVSPGMTDESLAIVFCTCKGELTKEYLEESEDIEPILVSQEKAKELLASGAKMDAKLFMVMQWFIRDEKLGMREGEVE